MNPTAKVESIIRRIEPEFPVEYIDVSHANPQGQLYIEAGRYFFQLGHRRIEILVTGTDCLTCANDDELEDKIRHRLESAIKAASPT